MPRYYIGNIPFGQDDLAHHGVKGQHWYQHIFGPDANTKYANWWKERQRGLTKAFNTAKTAVTGAANAVGNWATGNQARARQEHTAATYKLANQNANRARDNLISARHNTMSARDNYNKAARGNLSKVASTYGPSNFSGTRYSMSPIPLGGKPNGSGVQLSLQTPAFTGQQLIDMSNQVRSAADQYDTAQQNEDKAINAAARANNAAARAHNQMVSADQEYNQTLPGMADQAGRWISDKASETGEWLGNTPVGQAANKAGEWLGNKGSEIGRDLNTGMKEAGDWLGEQASNIGNTVSGAANKAGEWLENTPIAQGANKLVKGIYELGQQGPTLREIGSDLSKRANEAGEWLGEQANNGKQWLSEKVANVRDFATGRGGNSEPQSDQNTFTVDANGNTVPPSVAPEGKQWVKAGSGNATTWDDAIKAGTKARENLNLGNWDYVKNHPEAVESYEFSDSDRTALSSIVNNPNIPKEYKTKTALVWLLFNPAAQAMLTNKYSINHSALYTGHALMHSDHRRMGTCIIKDISRR